MTSLPTITANIGAVKSPAVNGSAAAALRHASEGEQFNARLTGDTPATPIRNRISADKAITAASARTTGDMAGAHLLQARKADLHTVARAARDQAQPTAATASADDISSGDSPEISQDDSDAPDVKVLQSLIASLQAESAAPANTVPANTASASTASGDTAALSTTSSAAASPVAQQPALEDTIKQLTILLQQALTASSAEHTAGTPAPQDVAIATDGNAKPAEDDKNKDDVLAQAGALIQSLLAQQSQQASEPVAADAHSAASADITVNGGASGQSAPQLADALSRLATMLEAKSKSDGKNAPIAISGPANAKTGEKPSVDLQSVDSAVPLPADKHSFQQTITDVIDALNSKENTKQDANPAGNSTDATPAIAAAAPAPQAAQPADFAKQLQQPAPQQPAAVPDQVLVHIKNAISDGSSQIRIQLHPDDLGKVDVQITTDSAGKTSVNITSDNRHTLAMLQSDARALQDALRDIGLKTDTGGLNFNLRDSGQDARNASKQQQGGYTKVAGVADIAEDIGFSTTGSLYRMSVQQGLDIRV